GFPLYVPGPQQHLPEDYRRHGVGIGDVGRITPEGIFDFFFNIYLPADHPIHNNNVPENFVPLPHYASTDVFDLLYGPGNHSCHYRREGALSFFFFIQRFPGRRFRFPVSRSAGSCLALPHGAHLKKLENLDPIREYAAAHAESWYKYINGPRGRGLANGSLYLVTGWEK
ncbi:hypothetical protein B0H14DRAFT_2279279, partial [Mycena olivaceomarginata]